MRLAQQKCSESKSAEEITRRQTISAIFLWLVFGAGLLVEAFAPRLAIENHAFVMPQVVTSEKTEIRPDAIVERERVMQIASLVFTASGATGLAFLYRRTLLNALGTR